jgi:hypothetical protein
MPFGLRMPLPFGPRIPSPFGLSVPSPFGLSLSKPTADTPPPFGLSLSKPSVATPLPLGLHPTPFGLSLSKPMRRKAQAHRGGRYPAGAHAVAVGAGAPTPLCCSGSGRAAELTALTAFASFKQAAASQSLMRAARAGPNPALRAAPEIAPTGYHPPRRQRLVLRVPFDRLRANGVGLVRRGPFNKLRANGVEDVSAHPGAAPSVPVRQDATPTAAPRS